MEMLGKRLWNVYKFSAITSGITISTDSLRVFISVWRIKHFPGLKDNLIKANKIQQLKGPALNLEETATQVQIHYILMVKS